MRIYKLVISLLVFFFTMFTLKVIFISNAQSNIAGTTSIATENVNCWIFPVQELISDDKTKVTKKTDLKNMDYLKVVEKIKIKSFFETLVNDLNCSYDSLSTFKRNYDSSVILGLEMNHELFLNPFNKYYSHIVNLIKDKKEIVAINIYDLNFRRRIMYLSYAFVIGGHNRRCYGISTTLYCEKIIDFGRALDNIVSLLKINLNESSLDISEYIPAWFGAELVRTMKLQVQFGDNCLEYQQELFNIMENICNILRTDILTLCSIRTSEIIDDHAKENSRNAAEL